MYWRSKGKYDICINISEVLIGRKRDCFVADNRNTRKNCMNLKQKKKSG